MSIQSIASPGLLTATSTAVSGAASQASLRQQPSASALDTATIASTPDINPRPQAAAPDQGQQVEAAIKAVKEFIQPMASNLAFEMDEDSGRTIIRITEASSGELIRQIPSEEMLEIAKALDRLQGLLVKQKA